MGNSASFTRNGKCLRFHGHRLPQGRQRLLPADDRRRAELLAPREGPICTRQQLAGVQTLQLFAVVLASSRIFLIDFQDVCRAAR